MVEETQLSSPCFLQTAASTNADMLFLKAGVKNVEIGSAYVETQLMKRWEILKLNMGSLS